MLYVFHVDTGTMMTFEMNLALGSVQRLKEFIEKAFQIPVEKQVLLVSGGECLDPAARVCSYSAGTDTNPIYFFSKSALENAKPPSPNFDHGSDSDMKDLVEDSLDLPVSYDTVVARAHLAQKFCELAREHTRVCEGLVHDQHLQQQGWAAAVANLEDITAAFKGKSEMFEQSYQQHLEGREENLMILKNFSKDLDILAKIPILPPLMENALTFSNADGGKKSESGNEAEAEAEKEEGKAEEHSNKISEMTLLMWISMADDQSTLEQMAEQAQRGLEQLDEEVLKSLKSEVLAALDASNKSGMKEIKGLEERLFGLEQLMVETKKIVQEQSDLAQALHQNQNRAGILNDTSVLPDLCASHRRQLVVMWTNQLRLCDIRRRCFKAKEELNNNLYHRLGWVMYVENLILNVNNKLMIYHENLKRLRRYVEITKQVQRAPQVYISAVSEVVRRKNFSQAFLTWASDMSCRLLAVYNEEFEKRREFQSQFEGHFLQSLFPGFEDNPPPFATQPPAPFDTGLPKLTESDVEQLKQYLPELPLNVSVTKLSTIAQMFLTNTISETKSSDSKENVPVEDRLVAAVSEIGLSSKLDETLLQPAEQEGDRAKTHQHRDDRDFESETDTEEFEKVCQSPVENGAAPESKVEVSSKTEVEVLRSHLSTAGKLANQTANHLKSELLEMKNSSETDREKILFLVKEIQCHISGITKGYSEEIEALHKKLDDALGSRDEGRVKENVEHETDNAHRSPRLNPAETDKVINELRESLSKEYNQKMEELKKKMAEEAEIERQKAVKEASDTWNLRHKTEMENLRSRFRLMSAAGMEKSPSEASLEKIERPDAIDLSKHEGIICQLREELRLEREKAVADAVDSEREKWKYKLETELKLRKSRMEEEKQTWLSEAVNRAIPEKNNQIDQLMLHNRALSAECDQLRVTIKLLTEGEQNRSGPVTVSQLSEVGKMISTVVDSEKIQNRLLDLSTSVSCMATSASEIDATSKTAGTTTDPVALKEAPVRCKSRRSTGQHGKISITSCRTGDVVFVVWNSEYSNYTIYQDNPTLHFIDSGSLDDLGLKPVPNGFPDRIVCTARVVEREYCSARKHENRYNVLKGTTFYVVKLKPFIGEKKEASSSKHREKRLGQQASTSSQSEDISASIPQSPKNSQSSLPQSPDSGTGSGQIPAVDVSDRENDDKRRALAAATNEQ